MTALGTEHVVDLSRDLPLTLHEAGSGPTVLLLHGGAGPESVSSVVEHFMHTHHVLAPTHPGWNGTPRPDRLNSVASLAAAYLDLLAQRGLQDVSVLGSSFGGWIAAQMAIQDTASRVGSIILIDAIGPRREPQHRPASDRDADAPPASGGPSAAALALLGAYTGPDMWDADLSQNLAGVAIPALIVWGEHDPVLTPDFGRAYARAIPGATFTLIEGAGHLPTSQAPEPTFTAVDEFLTSNQASAADAS